MPIANYSVLKGRPTAGKVVAGASAHYLITLAADREYTVAVNIQSVSGSEVLYAIKPGFLPPDPAGLAALQPGIGGLKREPGGLALDFVRETIAGQPMITAREMSLLPLGSNPSLFLQQSLAEDASERQDEAHALQNAVVQLLDQAVADPNALLYAFGSAFADRGVVDGIHNIHMNQGNPPDDHGNDNGIWQDGAVFVSLPGQGTWTGLFLAFQTQSWTTDGAGNPVRR